MCERDTFGTYWQAVLEGNVGAWYPWYHTLEKLYRLYLDIDARYQRVVVKISIFWNQILKGFELFWSHSYYQL